MNERASQDVRDPDQELAHRMASGDAAGLASAYDRYGRAVYSLAFRILRERADAEDVTQDVFAQAWNQAGRYDPARGSFSAWLLTITRTRAIDRLRSRRPTPVSTDGEITGSADESPSLRPAQEAAVLAAEVSSRVRRALDALPPPQRVAIELAYYAGLTQAEIAVRLQEPLGTVKTRMRTGLLKLRALLQGA